MVLRDVSEVTPEWLTACLRTFGMDVMVERVTITRRIDSTTARIAHLAIAYQHEIANAPRELFLKLPNGTESWQRLEADFYANIVPPMQRHYGTLPFLPICYHAGVDKDGQSCLLLADLSSTHVIESEQYVPTTAQLQQVMDGSAMLHAYWWEHPRLGVDVGKRNTAADIDTMVARTKERFTQFELTVGDVVTPEQRVLLARSIDHWPSRRRMRVINGRGITLVHRDTHPTQFLYGRTDSQAVIVDWQSWRVDTGTDDLAYMIACHRDRAFRDQHERVLLRHYHDRLLAYGVTAYSWEECLYDYRASIVRCLSFLVAAWSERQCASGIWWRRVHNALAACEDFDCLAIL